MEEERQNLGESLDDGGERQGDSSRSNVGFPKVEKEKGGSGKKLLIILIFLAAAGGVAWFFFGRGGAEEASPVTPTISDRVATSTPAPTSSSVKGETIDRKEVKIQILNGSGITGAAGSLKTKLEDLGYSGIKVGNADKQDYTSTTVTFDSSIDMSIKEEILDKLKETYKEVKEEEKTLADFDIKIITGYPKGYSPTPTTKQTTPTTKPTSTITGSITPSTSITPTKTPTPTP